jgi:site-specific recombinase XerD
VTGPPDLSPRELVDRWLDRQRLDKADSTVADYGRRLGHFVEWCGQEGIDSVGELRPWDLEAYDTYRRTTLATITLRHELLTLRRVLEYAATLELVAETVPEAIDPPDVKPHEQTNDTFLAPDDAIALLEEFRSGGEGQHTRVHAFLELAWWTGARMGALRGLDLSDVDYEEGYVHFQHRPETGTPLKNGVDGERIVGISSEVVDVLRQYVRTERPDVVDDYGRKALFTSSRGRCGTNTIRNTSYYATVPCRVRDCPHGKERDSCDWYTFSQASRCPSSVSPHPVRSGSIMWQLNRGLRADVVSDRVNASVDVIDRYYDKVNQLDEFRERREQHLDKLGFDDTTDEDENA